MKFGVQGAIAATFASYFVCYLIRIVDTRKLIPFRVNHLRFYSNLIMLFAMCRIIHTLPARYVLWLTLLLLLLVLTNFKPLVMTAKKILRRS